jgi:flagellar biosynthesis/type III secretory pathway protein FliH
MNKQPNALRLADALENCHDADERRKLSKPTAAELRRLHKVNQELLEALQLAQKIIGHPDDIASKHIASVIAKATGESK